MRCIFCFELISWLCLSNDSALAHEGSWKSVLVMWWGGRWWHMVAEAGCRTTEFLPDVFRRWPGHSINNENKIDGTREVETTQTTQTTHRTFDIVTMWSLCGLYHVSMWNWVTFVKLVAPGNGFQRCSWWREAGWSLDESQWNLDKRVRIG